MGKKYGQELLDELRASLQNTKDEQARREERMANCEYDLDDCFVSSFCNGIADRKTQLKIVILEDEGLSDFPALFTLDGKLVTMNLVGTQYGSKFVTPDGQWINPWVKRASTLAKKGFKVGYVRLPAWVTTRGGEGMGLSGLANLWVDDFPSEFNYWTGETLEQWQERIGAEYLSSDVEWQYHTA